MQHDPFISPDLRHRIEAKLDAIVDRHGAKILLAVESGSRAWRFPSTDSDYDVRFIYVRPTEAYLSVQAMRDVIDEPIEDELDVGGWDLRKALQQVARSNPVIQEWLTSPIWYRGDPTFAAGLRDLVAATAELPAYLYHYDGLARRSLAAITEAGDRVRLKSYCYALRPIFALHWIRAFGTLPPMALPDLMTPFPLPAELSATIERLIVAKAAATEREEIARQPILDDFITSALDERPGRQQLMQPDIIARVDVFFRSVLLSQ